MDRDLPQEFDEVLDRPDPWGDITDADVAAEAPDSRSRRRKEDKKASSVTAHPNPAERPTPIGDPWAAAVAAVNEREEELAPTDNAKPLEPPEFESAVPRVNPPEATPATAAAPDEGPLQTAPPLVPPWPDRALDVLPYADRAAWPGTRERNDRPGDDQPPLTRDTPPIPAVAPDDAELDAYALSPPRPIAGG